MTSTAPAKAANAHQHDTHGSDSETGRTFQKYYRRVYQAFGFKKAYNFPLYFVTVGGMFFFILARLRYLNIDQFFKETWDQGEVFWFRQHSRRIGITIHLTGVLIGGLLAVLQFTPIIRQKYIWFHRACGYVSSALFLMGNVGAMMIMDRVMGGSLAMVSWFVLLGIMTTFGIINAYVNIKRLQIDQHRAWMIRTWAWAASIISLRLVLAVGWFVVEKTETVLYTPMRCDEIYWLYDNASNGTAGAQNPTSSVYPQCGMNAARNPVQVAVPTSADGPESVAAIMRPNFLMAAWIALSIHVFLAELYLWLTPAESYRLRVVSYEKQVQRGLRKRGDIKDAGVTSSSIGDAPDWWSMPMRDYTALKKQQQQGSTGSDKVDSKDQKSTTVRARKTAHSDSGIGSSDSDGNNTDDSGSTLVEKHSTPALKYKAF